LYSVTITSKLVSVRILIATKLGHHGDDKVITNVCGAMRRKCAVDPAQHENPEPQTLALDRHTFIPPHDALRFGSFPQTVDRIAVKSASDAPIGQTHRGLIIDSRQSLAVDERMITSRTVALRYQQAASQDTTSVSVVRT
jgi:hypothetical protein